MTQRFRRRNAQALYDMHYGPNMTPMVDVVMVILIFFMASTAFLGPEWFLKSSIPVTGARAPDGPPPPRMDVKLSVSPEGQTVASVGVLSGLSLADLDTRLRDEAHRSGPDKLIVLVDPEERVPYEDVVHVHDTCQRLGIVKVGLGTGAR